MAQIQPRVAGDGGERVEISRRRRSLEASSAVSIVASLSLIINLSTEWLALEVETHQWDEMVHPSFLFL